MATEIIVDTAQDEVCVELWDVLQAVKQRTLVYLSDNPHDPSFSKEVADMLFLMDRAGGIYRDHAENAGSHWTRMRAERAEFLDWIKENNDTGDELPLLPESGSLMDFIGFMDSMAGGATVRAEAPQDTPTN